MGIANYYFKPKQSDDFVKAIESYDDGRYILRYNGLTGYDVVLREQPTAHYDEHGIAHWVQEYLPVMSIMNPVNQDPAHWCLSAKPYIKELDRTHVRHIQSMKHFVRGVEENNENVRRRMIDDANDPMRAKEALQYATVDDRVTVTNPGLGE